VTVLRGVLFTLEGVLFHHTGDTDQSIREHAPIDGALSLVQGCFARYRLGLITGTHVLTAANVREILTQIDWHGWFEMIGTTTDLSADLDDPAASPKIIRSTLLAMGIQPSNAAVIGVTPQREGMAANGAGCAYINVGTTPLPEFPYPERATLSVPDLTDVPDALKGLQYP